MQLPSLSASQTPSACYNTRKHLLACTRQLAGALAVVAGHPGCKLVVACHGQVLVAALPGGLLVGPPAVRLRLRGGGPMLICTQSSERLTAHV